MNFIQGIVNSSGSFVWTLLAFLLVLSIIVFVHEFGHYLAGRWCGVKIQKFSIGFGKELFGRTDQYGTRWSVAAIPLGGYVQFYGDENAASMPASGLRSQLDDEQYRKTLPGKPLWQRSLIAVAGPLANLILTLVLFTALFLAAGERVIAPVVGGVVAQSPAAKSGIITGDRIVAISGQKITRFRDIIAIVGRNQNTTLEVSFERRGEVFVKMITPACTILTDGSGKKIAAYVLGINANTGSGAVDVRKYGVFGAIGAASAQSWFVISQTLSYLGDLITGQASASQLGGPLKIAEISGQAATLGLAAFINVIAILSLSIGILNLLPIPMLDGGHLLLYGVEAIYGRPLGEKIQKVTYAIGLAMVLGLMAFVIINDFVQFYFGATANLCANG